MRLPLPGFLFQRRATLWRDSPLAELAERLWAQAGFASVQFQENLYKPLDLKHFRCKMFVHHPSVVLDERD